MISTKKKKKEMLTANHTNKECSLVADADVNNTALGVADFHGKFT